MAAGLLSQWSVALGSALLWPNQRVLYALCSPLVQFTDVASVQADLSEQAMLRRLEPQRGGLSATAVRVGLATVGRWHWHLVGRVARRAFEDTAAPAIANVDPRPEVPSRVSVVLLNWNSGSLGRLAATSIADQKWGDVELIVVDNASSDDSLRQIEDLGTEMQIVRHSENLGFGVGMNSGIDRATGEFVLPLNCDATIDPTYIAGAVAELRRRPRVAAVGGRVRSARSGTTGPIEITSLMRTRAMPTDVSTICDKVNGACPVFRTAALRQVVERYGGPYDPDYGMYGEDIDLALTLGRLGWSYFYTPTIEASHVRSYSSHPRLAGRRGALRRSTIANRHRNIVRHGARLVPLRIGATLVQDVGFAVVRTAARDTSAWRDVAAAWQHVASRIRKDVSKRRSLAPASANVRAQRDRERSDCPQRAAVDVMLDELGCTPGGSEVVVVDAAAWDLECTLHDRRPDLVVRAAKSTDRGAEDPTDRGVAVMALADRTDDLKHHLCSHWSPYVDRLLVVVEGDRVAHRSSLDVHRWRSAFVDVGMRVARVETFEDGGSANRPSTLVAVLERPPLDRAGDRRISRE